jgi:predicted nucleic acid-binding protein
MRNEHDGGRKTGLRVVLDTNVYISIFTRPESAIFQVWTHAVRNHYELIVSPVIVAEFARVSRRDFHWDEKKVRLHVRVINKTGTIVVPRIIPDVIKEDPPDNHILACALAGASPSTSVPVFSSLSPSRSASRLTTVPMDQRCANTSCWKVLVPAMPRDELHGDPVTLTDEVSPRSIGDRYKGLNAL